MKAIMRDKAELKDSGIEWIGLYPVSWDMYPANGVFSEIRNKNTSLEYTNQFSFRYGEIVDKHVQGELDDKLKDTISAYNIVQPDTIMINGLNLNYDFISQRVAIVREPGIITSAYLALYPNKERINPRFAVYLFKAYDYQQVFHGMGSGIRKTLSFQNFKNIFIVAPQLGQQEAIANYLDDNCSKIDAIIAEAKASIEEYKELKQAVIYEAVTKGLDKNVEMKDSGIEWIGKMPKNWSTVRFSKVNWIRARLGWKGLKADEYVDEGYPFLSAFNIQNNKLIWENINHITIERYEESPEIKLQEKDILLVKDGAGIGKCARIDNLPLGESTVNSSLAVITSNKLMNYKYEYFYLLSPIFQNVITRLKNGMGVPHLTQEAMKEIVIPCPPIEEQTIIADYLDDKMSKIDLVISTKQSLIEDLESYKKSIIYEVVTGKRKVVE